MHSYRPRAHDHCGVPPPRPGGGGGTCFPIHKVNLIGTFICSRNTAKNKVADTVREKCLFLVVAGAHIFSDCPLCICTVDVGKYIDPELFDLHL